MQDETNVKVTELLYIDRRAVTVARAEVASELVCICWSGLLVLGVTVESAVAYGCKGRSVPARREQRETSILACLKQNNHPPIGLVAVQWSTENSTHWTK
ncbi:hypothetical protein DPEC_G00023860 [Dallia pectoralis]|uniref:Uncharacterized protein n=1 Tax=Dallia pectoralis TaxID=75939 RepID=A0ACC2HGU4_DALPE|nr:hypothetical protein DPEC_G00023860 [Dallia pectoralis]